MVTKIASEENLAYPFTKTLTVLVFEKHVDYMGIKCHTPIPIRPEWRIRTESGARDYILGLIDLFFLIAELVLVVIQTISLITKNHLHL